MTHEQYIQNVRDIAIAQLASVDQQDLLRRAKLIYGRGTGEARGVTCYSNWAEHRHGDTDGQVQAQVTGTGLVDLVEICASGEESLVQLAGTTIHELAHVLAGHGAGHGKDWKQWCKVLGLTGAKAKGTRYDDGNSWDEGVLKSILALENPIDGRPAIGLGLGLGLGQTRTGKSGCATGQRKQKARLRLYECGCTPKPIKVRVASDDLNAMCMTCGEMFKQPNTETTGMVQ